MARKLEEITLIYDRERIRWDSGTAILECRRADAGSAVAESADDLGVPRLNGAVRRLLAPPPGQVIVKVECEPEELVQGLTYRFYGGWITHEKFGRQVVAQTFVRCQPHGQIGILRYLQQAPHVGVHVSSTLWDKFGSDAVRILRERPDVAAAAVGGQFGEERAAKAAEYLQHEAAIENCLIDLLDLFAGRGFRKTLAKQLIKEFGNRAAELTRKNPYLLLRFPGTGFPRSDQLYLDQGGRAAALKRQALAAWHAIDRDTSGHTWFPPAAVSRGVAERVGGANVRPVDAARLAVRAKLLSTHRDAAGGLWFAHRAAADAEASVAERVRRWVQQPSQWPAVASLDVSEHQREKLFEALQGPLAIFMGSAGTGKTFSAARVIGHVLDRSGVGALAVAAPTGKAAVRISEAMQGYGVQVRARTIHSLLGVESHSEGEGWGFRHNAENPLPYRHIVVDESSMVDTSLASSLFRACAPGTHLLLVGDPGQLPPVGHGAPLRDLIAAGVPAGLLTEIRRNAGDIVIACHRIRNGQEFQCSDTLDPDAGKNLRLLPATGPQAAMDAIIKTIKTIGARRLADPIWDVQVIVAVNQKSQLCRVAINKRLQAELNPAGARAEGNPFRVGDKIVCNKNGFYPTVADAPEGFNEEVNDDQKVFVANGEQGCVKHVERRMTIAQMDAPRRLIKIPRGTGGDDAGGSTGSQDDSDGGNSDQSADTGCQWCLAYGVTAHKAQGSQWPIVIVVLDEYAGARMVCSREWLYTAVSRAQRVSFLVGKIQTAYGMLGREAIGKRKTFLREMINVGSQSPRIELAMHPASAVHGLLES